MKSNNVWYLDRGKNFFTPEGKMFFAEMIAVFNSLSIYKNLSSNDIIEKLPEKYKESGNPNALLTTVRNIGIINKKNEIANNVKYYLDYKLEYDELIFENLTKINYDKENEINVKPFFLICIVLYELYLTKNDYAIITKKDCIQYLYNLISYERKDVFNIVQKLILDSRDFSNVKEPVLDIWFNALNSIEIFVYKDKNSLCLNEQKIDFFRFIYEIFLNGEIEKFNDGIYGCIPVLKFNDNLNECDINVPRLFEYLFGIEKHLDIERAFSVECYGIYKPFDFIKNIAIRKVEETNYKLSIELFKCAKEYI